jgi:hypothetical protein
LQQFHLFLEQVRGEKIIQAITQLQHRCLKRKPDM